MKEKDKNAIPDIASLHDKDICHHLALFKREHWPFPGNESPISFS